MLNENAGWTWRTSAMSEERKKRRIYSDVFLLNYIPLF